MRRFSGRREVALGLGAYGVYLLVRALVFDDRGRRAAARNARRLERLERRLGLHWEPAFQRVLLERPGLMRGLAVGYVVPNVVLTVGSLMWLFFARNPEYHRIRRAGLLSIVGSSAVFLVFPCDAPRKLDHLVDVIREDGVDLESGLVVRLYNPIAAFPSMHMAFAVVTTAAARAALPAGPLRTAALAYPPAVAFVVLSTANHFVVDALAGAAVGVAGLRAFPRRGSRPPAAGRRRP